MDERYARQTSLPEVGADGQARLRTARVLVVGAGGLGAPVLQYLGGAGVGTLTVIDPDSVSLSNLHRQVLFSENDLGRSKAEAAATRVRALNPDVAVEAVAAALDPANALDWVQQADLVIDCADSVAATYVLSDCCRDLNRPLISASVLGLSGYAGAFCGGAPSVRAVFPSVPDQMANCQEAGVLGPVVGILGTLQAQMALAVLLNLPHSPLGMLVRCDASTFRFSEMRFTGAPEPEHAFPFVAVSQLQASDRVIELRGVQEAPASVRADVLRVLPEDVDQLPDAAPGQRTVFCCHSGLRAWRAASRVQSLGGGELALLAAANIDLMEN